MNVRDPNNGYTPLFVAITNNRSEVVKYLLQKGAATDHVRYPLAFMALNIITPEGQLEMLKLLHGFGIPLHTSSSTKHNTLLHKCAKQTHDKSVNVAKFIVEKEPKLVKAVNDKGVSILHNSVLSGQLGMVECILGSLSAADRATYQDVLTTSDRANGDTALQVVRQEIF